MHPFLVKTEFVLQLLDVMEDCSNYLDNGMPLYTVYFDFAKAFDTVPHQR